MTSPAAKVERYEVGRTYPIPILKLAHPYKYIGRNTVTMDSWEGWRGALPVLTPMAEDEKYLSTIPHHVHVDWRFIAEDGYRHFLRLWGSGDSGIWTRVLTIPWRQYLPYLVTETQELVCLRPPTDAPKHFDVFDGRKELRADYACAAIINGKCPHRGTPAAAMIQRGDLLMCPAHGLKFNKNLQVAA